MTNINDDCELALMALDLANYGRYWSEDQLFVCLRQLSRDENLAIAHR